MNTQEKAGKVIAIVGLQFGSEGKGAISQYLSPTASVSVRIGAANAGHTVYHMGKSYVMRTLPCGWVNPVTKIVIGISSMISLPVLLQEIEIIEQVVPIKHRLYIDASAHIITDDQIMRELQTELATQISSTSAKSGLGIGTATADKILRSSQCKMAKHVPELQSYICDTVELLNDELDQDQLIILEGTQGFGLSIDHGFFPYVTSRDTTAQSLFAGTGLNPYGFDVEVIGVARAYPIRVGGHSGPFDPDSQEITWDEVARRSSADYDLTEKTSVTKSIRRVATFSFQGIERSARVNRVSEIALTFADHIDASIYGKDYLSEKVIEFIYRVEQAAGVEVGLVKTGPEMTIDFNRYRSGMLRKLA